MFGFHEYESVSVKNSGFSDQTTRKLERIRQFLKKWIIVKSDIFLKIRKVIRFKPANQFYFVMHTKAFL